MQLVEPGRGRIAHEPASGGPLGEGDRARHPVVGVALDEDNEWIAGEGAGELVGLGLDRLAQRLVVRAHPLVCRHAPGIRNDS
jgi:hypothetical protein